MKEFFNTNAISNYLDDKHNININMLVKDFQKWAYQNNLPILNKEKIRLLGKDELQELLYIKREESHRAWEYSRLQHLAHEGLIEFVE